MKNVRNLLGVVVVLVVSGSAKADLIVTTETIHSYMGGAGNTCCSYTTMDGFTVDGVPREDVWAIIISEIGGEFALNGYGKSMLFGDVAGFQFIIFGSSDNPSVPAHQIIPIINDDDPELFMIGGGNLTVGLGEDIVLSQEALSINGGTFGDISEIFYSYDDRGAYSLDTVALVIPEPATVVVLGFGVVVSVIRRRRMRN